MSHKYNDLCDHKFSKAQYRVTHWSDYDRGLVWRGAQPHDLARKAGNSSRLKVASGGKVPIDPNHAPTRCSTSKQNAEQIFVKAAFYCNDPSISAHSLLATDNARVSQCRGAIICRPNGNPSGSVPHGIDTTGHPVSEIAQVSAYQPV